MSAVVDEGVPRQRVSDLLALGCDIQAFPNEWKGLQNGKLLERIKAAGFRVLVTCDKSFRHQQNVERWGVALVVLPSPFLRDLLPYYSVIAETLSSVEPGRVMEVVPRHSRQTK